MECADIEYRLIVACKGVDNILVGIENFSSTHSDTSLLEGRHCIAFAQVQTATLARNGIHRVTFDKFDTTFWIGLELRKGNLLYHILLDVYDICEVVTNHYAVGLDAGGYGWNIRCSKRHS